MQFEKSASNIDELNQIIEGMFNKILEHQTTNRPIRGIGSNQIGRFNTTECEMIKQRIMSIQSGSESKRRSETLFS